VPYEVHGDGPYFVFDKRTQRMASMVSFTTQGEAEEFVKRLNLNEPKEEEEE